MAYASGEPRVPNTSTRLLLAASMEGECCTYSSNQHKRESPDGQSHAESGTGDADTQLPRSRYSAETMLSKAMNPKHNRVNSGVVEIGRNDARRSALFRKEQ